MCAPLLLLTVLSLTGSTSPVRCEVVSARVPPAAPAPAAAPQFIPASASLVAAVGDHLTLECRVRHLQDKMVSWVRSRDLQILAAGGAVFTGDTRVAATRDATGDATSDATDDTVLHSLSIAGVRSTDAGRYECQVNTEPKMSQFYNLIVLDSPLPAVRVHISGERTRRVPVGGSVRLHCAARYQTSQGEGERSAGAGGEPPPLEARWYKGDQPIDIQNPWGGVSLESRQGTGGARSSLQVARVGARHAGGYSCRAGAASDTVHILVLDDDPQMDAMQRDQSLTSRPSGGVVSLGVSLAALGVSLAVLCL